MIAPPTPAEHVAYLAGPMTGYRLLNFPAFMEAAIRLRKHGWIIFNPAEHDIAHGQDPAAGENHSDPDHPLHRTNLLRVDFRFICDEATDLIVLPGWEKSTGCRAEMTVAAALELPIWEYNAGNLSRVRVTWDILKQL